MGWSRIRRFAWHSREKRYFDANDSFIDSGLCYKRRAGPDQSPKQASGLLQHYLFFKGRLNGPSSSKCGSFL